MSETRCAKVRMEVRGLGERGGNNTLCLFNFERP